MKMMKISLPVFLFLLLLGLVRAQEVNPSDTLKFPFSHETGGLYLDNQITYEVVYDPLKNQYVLWPKIGNIIVSDPIYLSSQDYLDLILKQNIDSYYKEKSRSFDQAYRSNAFGDADESSGSIIPSFRVRSKTFESIFGGNEIQLIPQGSAQLDLGLFIQKIDNPQLLPQNRNTLTVDLRQRIQMSVLGKVGENLQLRANYDTQAGFGFENEMKLQWKNMKDGGEDDIIQNIELGNISMPLNTSLITGAQSLFGVRTDLRFGKTDVTMVFSEQKSETRNITVQGGGVLTEFKIFAEKYDYNRNFFLGQFFRDTYDNALSNYPQISSDIVITRLEVWRIDRGGANQEQRRSILALRDLGESGGSPTNGQLYNTISSIGGIREVNTARAVMNGYNFNGTTFQDGENYLVNENVRRLDPSEYTFHPSLGYISLNQPLVDGEDLLAVSFQYTRNSQPGQIFTVGEMSNDQSQLLITKLIKPNTMVNTSSPMWNLMMKNIYSINAMSISPEDFVMNIEFKDNSANATGVINYLPNTPVQDQTLLQVMNMDRLNENGNLQLSGNGFYGDGLFDFVPGITVNPNHGTIIFTTVEPFGSHLANKVGDPNSPYIFKELYTQLPNTLDAERLSQRYSLSGRYKGEVGGGIPLGAFNVPQGSVKVTANGQQLMEGVDYTVDYQLGQVTILNEQLKNSGVPINISLENQSTFNMQKKRFMGVNVDHRFSDNFLVGGTILNYQERPLTRKAQFGNEPVSNTILGLHTQYQGESEFLTRIANKIPGIKTDQISQINFSAEGAYLMPGTNKAAGGFSYIDDFEDAQSRISVMDPGSWRLGSTPGKPAGLEGTNVHPYFPNGASNDNLDYGNGRRLMSWYSIDPRFYGIGGNPPSGISDAELSRNAVRRVELRELFDQRDVMAGTAAYINTFDMTFYPQLKGQYNVKPNATDTEYWGATMRPISVTNFIESNIEYLEFWMMDPYGDQGTGGEGELLIHLGNVSEDILKDGQMMYENGMPHSGNGAATSQSNWGKQPENYPILYAYDTEGAARKEQDLGYNGLTDAEEQAAYGISSINPVTGENDPASDNYVFYLDDRWGQTPDAGSITGRYKFYQGPQGNNSTDNMLDSYSMMPDAEDINLDYNLDQTEMYNQYRINISPSALQNNENNFIVATKEVQVTLANGQSRDVKWYQFRVPVDAFDTDIDGDGIPDLVTDQQLSAAKSVLSSVRFMRLVMRGFQQETTLRFGTMDFVRSNWRRYPKTLFPIPGSTSPEEGMDPDQYLSNLEIGQVNIEENSTNQPPYVLPPGVDREQLHGTTGYQSQNEASMVLKAKLNAVSPAKAVYKNTNLDLRQYKRMEMFVSAQNLIDPTNNQIDENTKLFIRLGSDYVDNYYEYEIPLKYTPRSAITVDAIWPNENKIDISTDFFVDAKKLRDTDQSVTTLERFMFVPDPADPNKVIYVKGRPSLGGVTSLMIGLRSTNTQDKEVLVWVNELRLSEIDNSSGYAAMASLGFTLGDFAQIQLSGSVRSAGFGAIDQGPSQRSQDDYRDYALNAQLKLDKFLPQEWGVEIPFNFTISEQFSDPKYNPIDNDVLLKEDPRRDELKDVVRTYAQQKSFTFSNVRKIKTSNTPNRFYDPSNFSLSFMYADSYMRDIYTSYHLTKMVNTSLNYNYNFKPKYYQPFKDWRAVNDTARSAKYLKFIKEINVNPVPTRFSFRTEVNRTYTERQYRDLTQYFGGSNYLFPVAFSNNFLFSWQYNIGFDLTKSLRLDYTSSTRTLNDGSAFEYADKNLVWNNLFRVGRPVNYDQQVQLNWKTPIHLLPYMNWTSLELGFTSNYNWQARSNVFRNAPNTDGQGLGNIAQNSNSINLIGDFDLTKFYSEFKGYNKLDSIKRGRKREIDSLARAYETQVGSRNRNRRGYKFKTKFRAQDYGWMILSSIKKINFNYNQTNGAVIPGILAEPNFFGFGKNGGSPGAGFIFGTEFDIKRTLIESGNDWVTNSNQLLEPYEITKGTNFMGQAMLEPFTKLRIDLNVKRSTTYRSTEIGFNQNSINSPTSTFLDVYKTLNSSNIAISTSFQSPDKVYEAFIENTKVISERLGMANGTGPLGDGYYDGFGLSNYDVLVPSMIAAIEGRNAKKSSLGYNRKVPLPNWNITYSGLTDIPTISRTFEVLELSHAYISSYTANGIQSNPFYFMDPLGRDLNNNFNSKNIYGSINMIESFSPLIGVDMTFRNNFQFRAQYNRDRLMTMSLSNYTMTEDHGNEYVIGMGYVMKNLRFRMRYQGRTRTYTGDLNFRADIRMRDSETRIRRILDNDSQVTGGQKLFSVMFSADYSLTKNFNLKFFWDQMMTEYKISTAYPISTIRAGFSATLTFGN